MQDSRLVQFNIDDFFCIDVAFAQLEFYMLIQIKGCSMALTFFFYEKLTYHKITNDFKFRHNNWGPVQKTVPIGIIPKNDFRPLGTKF